MKFKGLTNFIENAKHFMIPKEIIPEFYLLKIHLDPSEKDYLDETIIQSIDEKFRYKIDFPKIKKKILHTLISDDRYTLYIMDSDAKRSKDESTIITILYRGAKIPEDMVQCDNCGNIWDGNAQCNCYMDPFY